MQVIRGARSIEPPWDGSVVTLGTFDGVHQGHQALIRRAVEVARGEGVRAAAYTFDPHPARTVAPQYAPKTLMPLDRRIDHMAALGIDTVVIENFDATFAQVPADDWVETFLVDRLRPRLVVVGFNFTYGRARGGNPEQLRRMGAHLGFRVEEVSPVRVGAVTASSSRVRAFLLEGNPKGARDLLGRPYGLTGVVVKGDQRGRSIGFPTANLELEGELVPAHGVYATQVRWLSEPERSLHPAITNIGARPTFRGQSVTVETHLLDFDDDLYGQRVEVELLDYIRGERRFDGPDELVTQIRSDVRAARDLLGVD